MKDSVPYNGSMMPFPAVDSLPGSAAIGQPAPAGLHAETQPPGMEGHPLPARLGSGAGVVAVLFLGFFLLLYVSHAGRKFLQQEARGWTALRVREDFFDGPAGAGGRVRFFILLAEALFLGISAFVHFRGVALPALDGAFYAALFLGILLCWACVLVKWLVCLLVGWLFFDRLRTSLWVDSYFAIVYFALVLWCPCLLLRVYFDWSAGTFALSFLLVAGMAKILVFYNCIKFFSTKFYGLFYLIVYFCALEIMPCLIMYKGLSMLNNLLLK